MAALTTIIPVGKIGWTTDDHWNLVNQLLPSLKDEAGKSVTIGPALGNILKLIYKPTEDAEKDVLRQAFADAGCVLDEDAESTLVMLFSGAQFADLLAKWNRPNSTDKFILKDKTKKRGAKKDTFAALLAAGTPAPEPPPSTTPPPAESIPPETSQIGNESSDETAGESATSDSGGEVEEEVQAAPAATAKPSAKVVKK